VQQASLLEMDWSDGTTTRLSASTLRGYCRCALCMSVKPTADGTVQPAKQYPDIRITLIEAMGSNAINLQFSDGHDRGIFPFSYLRSLSAEATVYTAVRNKNDTAL